MLQDVLDLFVELISELVESIEEKPLKVKLKFSDLADFLRVLQEGVSTIIETNRDDIEGIQNGALLSEGV